MVISHSLPVLLGALCEPTRAEGGGSARQQAGAHLPPGKTTPSRRQIPAELSAYTLRAAASQGPAVAAYAERLFDGPLPWAKLRQGRLGERYSPDLDAACRRALSVDLIDVRRLERILVEALEQEATQPEPRCRSIRQAGRRLRSCQAAPLIQHKENAHGSACSAPCSTPC